MKIVQALSGLLATNEYFYYCFSVQFLSFYELGKYLSLDRFVIQTKRFLEPHTSFTERAKVDQL